MDKIKQVLSPLSPVKGGRSVLPSILKTGDIILSTTNRKLSRLVRSALDLPISHASIVYDTENSNNPHFVESVPEGVQFLSFKDMMRSDSLSVAFRKKNLTNAEISLLQKWLLSKLGADYDYGAVFNNWLQLRFKFQGNLFPVDLGSPKKFYCSELVFEAYRQIGIHLIDFDGWDRLPGRFIEMTWFDQIEYVGHLKY